MGGFLVCSESEALRLGFVKVVGLAQSRVKVAKEKGGGLKISENYPAGLALHWIDRLLSTQSRHSPVVWLNDSFLIEAGASKKMLADPSVSSNIDLAATIGLQPIK